MHRGILLAGIGFVVGVGWFAGCAAGDASSTSGSGAASTSSGSSTSGTGGTTTTTSTGGETTTTTTMGTGGTGGSTATGGSGTGGMATGTGGMATGTGGTGGSGPPPGLPLGATCTMDSDCQSMLCKPVVIGSPSVCVTPCTQQADCGAGTSFFCEPTTAGSTSGYCIPHSPAHCLSCNADSDCGSLSEVCFQAPGDNVKACHIDCSIAGASACPSDYSCVSETANGQSRQLCRPSIIPTCLDAVGGYCDRLTIPQPCVRTNGAGTCIGERACLASSKRFDKCDAMAPQCKGDCSLQDPAGCTESYCPGATGGVTSCGTCGNVCPGYQKPNDNVTCNASQMCTFSCQGEHYDLNGNVADGCEVQDSPLGNHTQGTAYDLGSMPCTDGSSNPNIQPPAINPHVVSDTRVHELPSVAGFNATTGAAPDWYHIYGTGGTFCQDDIGVTLQVNGSSQPACYKLTIITNKGTYTAQANGSGTASISSGSGSYSDNSDIYIVVEKTCSTSLTENVTYTVTGHF